MHGSTHKIRKAIEEGFSSSALDRPGDLRAAFNALIKLLERGAVRAAEPGPEGWVVNAWVKKGILLGFRMGELEDCSIDRQFKYFDKDTLSLRVMGVTDGVRIVPGGTTVRSGSHLARGVIIMPPSYINIGAFVGAGTMIDSNALVGSCAQVGAGVHISAGAQIGGVLEPVGGLPVIIEDNVLVGGNCGVYEGAIVERDAILGAGVILTRSTPVFDVVRNEIYRATNSAPLRIPEGAVVVPGARPLVGEFADAHRLSLQTPVIVKYRDAGTDAAVALEDALRMET